MFRVLRDFVIVTKTRPTSRLLHHSKLVELLSVLLCFFGGLRLQLVKERSKNECDNFTQIFTFSRKRSSSKKSKQVIKVEADVKFVRFFSVARFHSTAQTCHAMLLMRTFYIRLDGFVHGEKLKFQSLTFWIIYFFISFLDLSQLTLSFSFNSIQHPRRD